MAAPGIANDSFLDLEKTATLESLPPIVLYQHVLKLLPAKCIFRVAACSRPLLELLSSDILWQPLCEELGWGPFNEGTSWFQGFSQEHSRLCVECGTFTKYVFKLLACRLCEKCEFAHPRYALVTRREATERYSLAPHQLTALDSIEFHSTRLFLRAAVTNIAAASIGMGGPSRFSSSFGSSVDLDSSEEEGEEEGEGDSKEGQPDSSDVLGSSPHQREDPESVAQRRAAEKAARKAHKKQVKAEKREKRQQKKGTSSGTSPLGTSPQNSGLHNFMPGSSPGQQFQPGSSPGNPFQAGSSPGYSRGRRMRRPHASRSPKVWSDDGTHVSSGNKVLSGWLAERQQLMAEWGEYALSGLVLAT